MNPHLRSRRQRFGASAAGVLVTLIAGIFGAASAQAAKTFQVTVGDRALTYTLPGSSAVTLTLKPGADRADAWLTSASASTLTRKLEQGPAVPVGAPAGTTPKVAVDAGATFQTIDGFGGAMTHSSAFVISRSAQREQIMRALFAASGARFTSTRLAVGASDFVASPTFQSYHDTADGSLAGFSIAHDEEHLIPLLRRALELSPSMKLHAAPWSAPGWMKFGGTFAGRCESNSNYLRNSWYPTYARYLAKYAKAYEDGGVPIDVLSLQNEPRHCNPSYGTMSMEPGDQADLAMQLRPALDAAGLGAVRILGYDHNWAEADGSPTTYPQQALKCAGGRTSSPIDAVGYHAYAGHELLATVQQKFRSDCGGRDIYFTEASGFKGASNTAANLVWAMRHTLIGPLRNWSRASMYWNLALDERHGPHRGGCGECTGMVTVKDDGTFELNEQYYYWAHFSKFVDPGAVRIGSTDPPDGSLQTVAFKNPDGAIVVVAMNPAGPESSPPPPPSPPPPAPPAPARNCDNLFAWLFGCSSPLPPPPPSPPAPSPLPPPPPARNCDNLFAWLFGC